MSKPFPGPVARDSGRARRRGKGSREAVLVWTCEGSGAFSTRLEDVTPELRGTDVATRRRYASTSAVLGLAPARNDTTRHVAFFHGVMGLQIRQIEPDFTVLEVRDGATVEVFGPRCSYDPHITSPVDDLEQAREAIQESGSEIVLPIRRGDTGAWLHFRAPDGHAYELSEESDPPRRGIG